MVDWTFEIGDLRLGEGSGRADDAVGDEKVLAAGFVGIIEITLSSLLG